MLDIAQVHKKKAKDAFVEAKSQWQLDKLNSRIILMRFCDEMANKSVQSVTGISERSISLDCFPSMQLPAKNVSFFPRWQ